MRTRSVRVRALLVMTVALALVAGCSSTSTAPAAGLEKTDLNVAVVPALDSAGFFVALYGGLFKAEGLNVHFSPATSSETVIADQAKGKYDITLGNYVSYIQAQQQHEADLYIFAEASVMGPATQGMYTMPDAKVTDLSGLKGKTVAINAPKNILYLLAASVLTEHGVDPSLVHFANIKFPEMAAELQSGAVSAALLPEPFASGAEQEQGVVPLVDLNQGATTAFPIAGYVATKQWAHKYPHTLAAFYKAVEEGQQIADTNRNAVEQALLRNKVAATPVIAATMTLDTYPLTMDVPAMQRVPDAMFEFNLMPGLKQPYQISEMIQPEPGEISK